MTTATAQLQNQITSLRTDMDGKLDNIWKELKELSTGFGKFQIDMFREMQKYNERNDQRFVMHETFLGLKEEIEEMKKVIENQSKIIENHEKYKNIIIGMLILANGLGIFNLIKSHFGL